MSWELVMDWETWHAAVHGVAKSRTWLSNWIELRQMKISDFSQMHQTTEVLGRVTPKPGGISSNCNWDLLQFSSVQSLSPTLCDPMNCSTPNLPVHHQLPEFTQTHVHRVGNAIQPSHPLSSPSPPAPNPSQHHSLFQWVNSSHEVAKVLEFQL